MMASIQSEDQDDLSLTSVFNTTQSSAAESKSPQESNIHIHCRTRKSNEPKRKGKALVYYCKYCESGSSTSTTGLRSHIRTNHKDIEVKDARPTVSTASIKEVIEMYDRLYKERQTSELDQLVLHRTIDIQLVLQALIDLIIVRRLPFRIVEWPEFHRFCAALNPSSPARIPSSHQTIKKRIEEVFPEAKDIVRRAIQSAKTRIHLAVDIWTSPNNYLFLAICASFIDHNDYFRNILIGLRTVPSQSGEDQWSVLLPVLEEYGCTKAIGVVTGDNSGTNDTLCRAISAYLAEIHRIDWNPSQNRIRCQGHIFNLVVQAYLFNNEEEEEEMASYDKEEFLDIQRDKKQIRERQNKIRTQMGAMGKLHNLIVHIRGSANRTREFVENAGRRVPLDNRTRWNSWYSMLEVAQQLPVKEALSLYAQKYYDSGTIDKRDILSPEDWIQLRTIRDHLFIFQEATLYLEGDRTTLERVSESLIAIQKWLQNTSVSYINIFSYHIKYTYLF